jgi:hypothetical protein
MGMLPPIFFRLSQGVLGSRKGESQLLLHQLCPTHQGKVVQEGKKG